MNALKTAAAVVLAAGSLALARPSAAQVEVRFRVPAPPVPHWVRFAPEPPYAHRHRAPRYAETYGPGYVVVRGHRVYRPHRRSYWVPGHWANDGWRDGCRRRY